MFNFAVEEPFEHRTSVEEPFEHRLRICVIGVGGGGGNAVENMIADRIEGVDFVVANTDAQALNRSSCSKRVQLGGTVTQGLGAGACPDIGRAAAQESIDELREILAGAQMCFIAVGMGGGTGTGAAPIIAAAARSLGILTVAVATKPFAFEGRRRAALADEGLTALAGEVDTLIVVPNQNLFRIVTPDTTVREAFGLADAILKQGVRGLTDLIVRTGMVNLDFADIRSVMVAARGRALLGVGEASGEDRAMRAAEAAVFNPLIDTRIDGATGLIISITGGDDLRLLEVNEAAEHVRRFVDPEADIIWGSTFDPALEGSIRVSIVVTGIEEAARAQPVVEEQYCNPTHALEAPTVTYVPEVAVEENVAAAPPSQVEVPVPQLSTAAEEPESRDQYALRLDEQGPAEPRAHSPVQPEPAAPRKGLFERVAALSRGNRQLPDLALPERRIFLRSGHAA